ncbi:MAG: hypothetical protein V2A34_05815 [Lentisphaerota bacterium]
MSTIQRVMILASLSFISITAQAQMPMMINYQGRLMNGSNLVNGTVNLQFMLYDAASGGSAQYIEQDLSVPVVDGLYSTHLGDNPLSGSFPAVLTNSPLWLELQVDGVSLLPREQLTAVSYALVAGSVTNGAISEFSIAEAAVTGGKIRNNAVTGDKIAEGSISNADLAADSVTASKIALNTVLPLNVNKAAFSNTFWMVQGNAGTSLEPIGDCFIGTVDNIGFDIRVNSNRVMRYRPDASSPLIVGGFKSNTVTASGSVIAGGGSEAAPQSIDDAFGFIGGGGGNFISNGIAAVISGGDHNLAGGNYAAVGGGQNNRALGVGSVVPGGISNTAAAGSSFAAGRRAKAMHAGSFVWADNQEADFGSRTTNQFLIRASRGFGLNVTNLAADIVLVGNPNLTTLMVAPGTNQPNFGGSQLMLAEDSAGSYGMLIQYDVSNEQLRVYEKDWLATNGPRLVISRRDPSRIGIGTTNLLGALTVSGNIVPAQSNVYSLGTAAMRWNQLCLGSEILFASNLAFIHASIPVMTVATNRSVSINPQETWTGTTNDSMLAFGSYDNVYLGERGHNDWMELKASQFYFRTGDVGIGTTNISSGVKLGINGDLETSGDYMFTSPRSGVLNLPAPIFQYRWSGSDETPSYESGQYVYCTAYGSPVSPYILYFFAPVQLPHGVVVTNFTAYYYDDSSATNVAVSATLRRRPIIGSTTYQMAGCSTNSSGRSTNVLSFFQSSIVSGTIDNNSYMYSVNVSWTPGETGDNLRFYGARIEYEASALSP